MLGGGQGGHARHYLVSSPSPVRLVPGKKAVPSLTNGGERPGGSISTARAAAGSARVCCDEQMFNMVIQVLIALRLKNTTFGQTYAPFSVQQTGKGSSGGGRVGNAGGQACTTAWLLPHSTPPTCHQHCPLPSQQQSRHPAMPLPRLLQEHERLLQHAYRSVPRGACRGEKQSQHGVDLRQFGAEGRQSRRCNSTTMKRPILHQKTT